jgi:hypothetical protein
VIGTLQERFEAKFQRGEPDACWNWLAGKCRDGYGTFDVFGKSVGAHRMAYELYVGEIPFGLQVLHSCDNPACVNPSHFFLGTHGDNMRDRSKKGRHSAGDRKGERHPMAVLTVDQVLAIRADARPDKVVAKDYPTSWHNVRNIRNRVSWRHV